MCNCPFDWFIDLLPCLSLVETRLVTAFMRFGSEESDTAGHNCIVLKASLHELCANTDISKPNALIAIRTFRDWGVLFINKNADSTTAKRGPHEASKYQLRTMMPRQWVETRLRNRGNKILPRRTRSNKILPLEKESNKEKDTHAVVGGILTQTDITATAFRGNILLPLESPVLSALAAIGFAGAESFMVCHPADRIKAALDYIESAEGLSNPAGYLRKLVEGNETIPVPFKKSVDPPGYCKKGDKDPDRFIKGKYGHVVKR